jgi:hypothetical protein
VPLERGVARHLVNLAALLLQPQMQAAAHPVKVFVCQSALNIDPGSACKVDPVTM